MITSHSFCRFVGCTSMMRISRSTTCQRCSIWLRSGDFGGHLRKNKSLSCSRNLRWFELCVAAEIKTHQTRQRFSNLLLSNFGEPVVASISCSCFLSSWQEQHPVWSSAVVAHLLQGSTCCVFRDGILHILVVTSGYLSYCCLSIISNQSAHSSLTSDINKACSSTQLPLTGYLYFSDHSL